MGHIRSRGMPGEEKPGSHVDSVAFFNRTFEEAVALAREARDYFAREAPNDRGGLSPFDRLSESCETMRITARLTQVIAWLLVQKAVHAGELTREDARAPERRLSGQAICGAVLENDQIALPPRLTDLLERSRQLYNRIERLDAMLSEGEPTARSG